MITCWSAKGGSGTSVVAAALAVLLARRPQGALLVDLCGDQPALLGCREPQGHGVRDWLVSATDTPPDALGRLEMDVVTGLRLLPTGSGGDVGARHPAETSAQQARARRRFLELSGMGEKVTEEGVLEQLKERDARDAARTDAPMKPADDAVWIDTTRMRPDECLAKAIEVVEARKADGTKGEA